ncbi:DUF3987 domain-containing protein [Streptomyces fructofermentans]|uniref:DUF3987 domain-containing protein n=1 Tax=Streptomyces fructofermentans TaxID=152141 RepID=A0A918K7Y4_9ACTN|nr:DUF3987 domain-containing protein [Streptomyces fructofermentans]GGX54158.1 hypothetical protein GCM10010515_21720 [Streptomyces fructofermentans]
MNDQDAQDAAGREGGPSPTGRPWPVLGEDAFHGLPGRIVRTIEPHTEADPAAMLFTLYAAAGAYIGRKPHMFAGAEEHGARIWPLIIGRTAGGVKGTSWAEIRRVMRAADHDFMQGKVVGGLSSAEGLIYAVRDGGDPDDEQEEGFDPGVKDKRLLVVETEFASVLAQGKREGNTLLPLIRQAWDGGTLRTMTIRPRVATDPHVVIIGHITPTELRVRLSEAERAGGTMNRFLPVMSKRSKLLPDGGHLEEATVKALGAELAAVLDKAKDIGRMSRGVDAHKAWVTLYTRLASDHAGDGRVAQVVARAAPQVLRLSVMAALLDGADYIDLPHMQAAEAMWDYIEDSAWYVFSEGTGDTDLDRLKLFVDAAGPEGVTRTAVANECFGKNKTGDQIDAVWSRLLTLDGYEEWSTPTKGRPVKRMRRTKPV